MGQLFSEVFIPKPTYVPERDIPDLTGKVIIVTGGNTGIGKEAIKQLLLKNAKVYMASRTKARAEQAIADLKAATGREAIFLEINLANLDSITRGAKEFLSKEPALHILFNSAGVMNTPIEQLTDGKMVMIFNSVCIVFPRVRQRLTPGLGTNVLGHAHLTMLLIPALAAGAQTSSDGKARVVNTGSVGSYLVNKIVWETLEGNSPLKKSMGTQAIYYQSKFGNAVFSHELARRVADQNITSNALNPGNLKTELQRHSGVLFNIFIGWMLYPAPLGALTQLYVGTSPETKDDNGAWFIPWARRGKIGPASKDPELGTKLWEWVEEQRKDHL